MRKLVGLSFIALLGFSSCKKEAEVKNEKIEIKFQKEGELSIFNEGIEIKKIDIELALTDYEQEYGLMHRSSMKEGQGMLFVHSDQDIKKQKYWMRNCRFPLDIIYIRPDSTVINIVHNAQPGDLDLESAQEDAKFVLEVYGGLSEKWGLKPNSKITYSQLK